MFNEGDKVKIVQIVCAYMGDCTTCEFGCLYPDAVGAIGRIITVYNSMYPYLVRINEKNLLFREIELEEA